MCSVSSELVCESGSFALHSFDVFGLIKLLISKYNFQSFSHQSQKIAPGGWRQTK